MTPNERYHSDPAYRAKVLAKAAEYREKNRQKIREYFRGYDATRKDDQREKSAAWRNAYPWRCLVQYAAVRARDKNLPFDLTDEWAQACWTGRCELSGIPFALKGRHSIRALWPSIDRKDPALGYTQTNCRFVLMALNVWKSDRSDEILFAIAQGIVERIPMSGGSPVP